MGDSGGIILLEQVQFSFVRPGTQTQATSHDKSCILFWFTSTFFEVVLLLCPPLPASLVKDGHPVEMKG